MDGKKFGVKIDYFIEKEPLGTTGGLKEIEHILKEDFIVLYGDIIVNMDLKKLIDFHKSKKGKGTLTVKPADYIHDCDLVEIDKDSKIINFHSKPHDERKFYRNLDNGCVYVLSPDILKHIEKGIKSDFGKDIFPKIIRKERLYGYKTAEYLKDIGTPNRFEEVTKDYLSGKVERFNSNNKRSAIFIDRDGTINRSIHLLHKIGDFELLPNSGMAIRKINDSEFLAIVITNQGVVARNLCSVEELEEIHKKMETLLGKESAKLDGIYYCPHHLENGHPDSEYTIDCECRKPKIGMIKKAEKDFNIDLKKSFFIGDSATDIQCGKNAGLTTVGVKTGIGYGNSKPDFIYKDLYTAVENILKNDCS